MNKDKKSKNDHFYFLKTKQIMFNNEPNEINNKNGFVHRFQ